MLPEYSHLIVTLELFWPYIAQAVDEATAAAPDETRWMLTAAGQKLAEIGELLDKARAAEAAWEAETEALIASFSGDAYAEYPDHEF